MYVCIYLQILPVCADVLILCAKANQSAARNQLALSIRNCSQQQLLFSSCPCRPVLFVRPSTSVADVALKMVQYTVEIFNRPIAIYIITVYHQSTCSKRRICTIQRCCSSSTFIAVQPNSNHLYRQPILASHGWRCVPWRIPTMIVDFCSCCRSSRMSAMWHALNFSVSSTINVPKSSISPRSLYTARFSQMKASGDYYVTVIEDTRKDEIIGAASLIIERKFIHNCAVVSREWYL